MADITGTFDEVKGHNAALIRKMLELSIFIGPEDADPVTTIASSGELIIPEGYESVGMLSKGDGATITPSIEMSEIGAYGYAQQVRRDAVSRNTTVAFTMLEVNRVSLEAYYGQDLSAVTAAPTSREVVIDAPDRPDTRYVRLLLVARDGQGTKAIHHAEFFPRALLTDVGAMNFSETDAFQLAVTFACDIDSVVGTSQRSIWGGPGWTSGLVTAMKFVLGT